MPRLLPRLLLLQQQQLLKTLALSPAATLRLPLLLLHQHLV
jgi:hypothetical protein